MPRKFARVLILGLAVAVVAASVGCGDEPTPTTPRPISRPLNQQIDTADITFLFAEGDSVNAEYMQAFHDWAVPYLGISMPQRLRYFKYFDMTHMREITGQPYGSWADIERYAIHSVERQQGHEAIHVYSYVIGWPSDYFTEGIAEALDLDPYTGVEPGTAVHSICRSLLQQGSLYPIRDIVTTHEFRAASGSTYAQAGSFVQFLIDEFGLEPLLTLFRTTGEYDSLGTILSAFESIYGLSLEQAEQRWHEFLAST